VGTIVTCTGNVSQGVAASGPSYLTLNVKTNFDITPAAGVPGVSLIDSGGNSLVANIDTTGSPNGTSTVSPFGPPAAPGILVQSTNSSPLTATTGDVAVTNSGSVSTTGLNAYGIYANVEADTQYSGGMATTGNLTVTNNSGNISATGDYKGYGTAYGIYAYNYANAQPAWSGNNGTATTGNVTVTNSSSVLVTGDYKGYTSYGIYAVNYAEAWNPTTADPTTATTGNLTVTNSGSITTIGLNGVPGYGEAPGIFAYNWADSSGTATTGAVTVTNSGSISTNGYGSDGIYANNSVDAYNSSGATTATGGDLTVTNSGSISTTGKAAYGIYAYSNANADNGTATAGNVTVNSTGKIATTGIGSVGIYAQSTAVGSGTITNGNIVINIRSK
jgi:hypothetical protein